jgi:hypothetical protein
VYRNFKETEIILHTHIKHSIDYELPTTGKIANKLSGSQADDKIRQSLEQAAQTVKQKLESGRV